MPRAPVSQGGVVSGIHATGVAYHNDDLAAAIADVLPLPIWMVAADGRVMYGNRRWIDLTGGIGVDVPARDWTGIFHDDDRAKASRAFASAVLRCEPFEIELRLKAADDRYLWAACFGTPYAVSVGRPGSFVIFCCDVSAKHRAESALDQVAGKLVVAQENERSRIARELHDDVGQQLALLASKLEVAARHTRELSRNRMQAALAEARRSLHDVSTTVHNLSHELHPAKLRLLGLGPTLETLCRNVSAESGVPVIFDRRGIPPDVPEPTALCVFRVAQEALRNAVKHSRASRITVGVSATPSQLVLRIVDDGAGFDPLESQSAGLGLVTMRERVELTGGTLRIQTAPAHGTVIEAHLPAA